MSLGSYSRHDEELSKSSKTAIISDYTIEKPEENGVCRQIKLQS